MVTGVDYSYLELYHLVAHVRTHAYGDLGIMIRGEHPSQGVHNDVKTIFHAS